MPTARWDDLRGAWTLSDIDGSPMDVSSVPPGSLDLMLRRLLPPARESAMSAWTGGLIREADAWFGLDPELLPIPFCEFRMRWTVPGSPWPERRCVAAVRVENGRAAGTLSIEGRRASFSRGRGSLGPWVPWSSRRVSAGLGFEDDMTGHTIDIDGQHTEDA